MGVDDRAQEMICRRKSVLGVNMPLGMIGGDTKTLQIIIS